MYILLEMPDKDEEKKGKERPKKPGGFTKDPRWNGPRILNDTTVD